MLLTVFHIVVPPEIATIYQVVEYRFFLKTAQLSFPPAVSPSGFCFCASLQRMIRLRKVSEFLWIMDFQLPCFFIESAFENPQKSASAAFCAPPKNKKSRFSFEIRI